MRKIEVHVTLEVDDAHSNDEGDVNEFLLDDIEGAVENAFNFLDEVEVTSVEAYED